MLTSATHNRRGKALDHSQHQDTPVYKVGAVIVRRARGESPEILIIQPKPKQLGEVTQFVLPRGSRQYWEWQGDGRRYIDIRDAETAAAHAEQLEPVTRTLEREIHEEAGIAPADLARAPVVDLGPMDFQSRTKGIYPIHWFIVEPDAETQTAMAANLPVDTLVTRWATVAQIKKLITDGNFSAGYLPVIEAALSALLTSPLGELG